MALDLTMHLGRLALSLHPPTLATPALPLPALLHQTKNIKQAIWTRTSITPVGLSPTCSTVQDHILDPHIRLAQPGMADTSNSDGDTPSTPPNIPNSNPGAPELTRLDLGPYLPHPTLAGLSFPPQRKLSQRNHLPPWS
ncbi:hypothetical protein PtB15_16B343 [Puccinia triticina]|nr:hypothetical protein PtB15_16B343 [Puccinia triticina]